MSEQVEEAVGQLRAAVDALLSADLDRLDRDRLLQFTRELETELRRLPVVDHRLIAALDSRGVAAELGATSTADLLRQVLRLTAAEAGARVRAAADLGPRQGLTGEPLPPVFPEVATAQAAGAITPAQARTITRLLDQLPHQVEADCGTQLQAFLVEQAQLLDNAQLAQLTQRLRDTLDPDGTRTSDADRQRRRRLDLAATLDGTGHLGGELTPAALAVWQAILDALAAPLPAGEDGQPDRRTACQRRHDAFLDAGMRILRSGTLPEHGGIPVTVLTLIDADQLQPDTDTSDCGTGCVECDSDLGPDSGPANGGDAAGDLADDTEATAPHPGSGQAGRAAAHTADNDAEATPAGGTDADFDRGARPDRDRAAGPRVRYGCGPRLTQTLCTHPGHAGHGESGHRTARPSHRHRRGRGFASTGHGGQLSLPELAQLAGEALIVPVYCTDTSGVLGYGTTRRTATASQRLALAARDRGCSFPGCTRPPSWCQAHHVTDWADGGGTDLANLTLLCGHHHRNFQQLGWQCVMTGGRPHWIPPAWLDQQQTPRRNTAHHLEIDFTRALDHITDAYSDLGLSDAARKPTAT